MPIPIVRPTRSSPRRSHNTKSIHESNDHSRTHSHRNQRVPCFQRVQCFHQQHHCQHRQPTTPVDVPIVSLSPSIVTFTTAQNQSSTQLKRNPSDLLGPLRHRRRLRTHPPNSNPCLGPPPLRTGSQFQYGMVTLLSQRRLAPQQYQSLA